MLHCATIADKMTEESVTGAIRGALQLRAGEVGIASREAVGPEQTRLGLTAVALGLALVGVGWNAIDFRAETGGGAGIA